MATKLDFLRRKPLNQADEIRQLVLFVEDASIGLSNKSRDFILGYLAKLDAIKSFILACEAGDCPDMTGERLKFETVQKRFLKNAPALLSALGGRAGLIAARPAQATQTDQPWWFIDQVVAAEKRRRHSRVLIASGAIIATGLFVVLLLNMILQPDFSQAAVVRHVDAAIQAVTHEANYGLALSEIEQALLVKPDNIELLIFKSIVLERLGRFAEAAVVYERAFALVAESEQIPYYKGQLLMQLAEFEPALMAAQESIDLNPSFAEGWLLVGQAYDQLHQAPRAFDAMTIAYQLAEEQDKRLLEGLIRFNMERLSSSARRR